MSRSSLTLAGLCVALCLALGGGAFLRMPVNLAPLKDVELSEAMDDRFMVAFNERWFDKGDVRIAAYVMRAVYPGDMRFPDTHAELMYSPQVNGRSVTGEVKVVAK